MGVLNPAWVVLLTAWFAASGAVRPSPAQEPLERDVKAAFLFNFTKFVDWPSGTPAGNEPFRLCVVSDAAFRRSVEQTIAGETVNGRPLQSLAPRTVEEARRCQMLFVSRTEMDAAASRLLAAVRDLPVLTVSDRAQFARDGGGIELVRDDNRIRFDINVPGAERGGIKLSSRLLRVARNLHESPKKH